MEVIKPISSKHHYDLDCNDDFFNHSHGVHGDHTLCSIACEEWGYTDASTVRKITCPQCLELIRYCKSYRL